MTTAIIVLFAFLGPIISLWLWVIPVALILAPYWTNRNAILYGGNGILNKNKSTY